MRHVLNQHQLSRTFLFCVFVLAFAVAAQPALAASTVDLNTATKAELMELPGVGEVIAGRIIAYRDEQPFKSVDELVQVKGIGDKTLAKIRDRLTVGSSGDQ